MTANPKFSESNSYSLLERGRQVVLAGRDALDLLAARMDENFVDACTLICGTSHRLVVTGMGKSGHIARKVAATFSGTRTPAVFLHPAEAAHGDLGNLTSGDVLLAFSNSGSTSELRAVLDHSQRIGVPIIGVASQAQSMLMEYANVRILLPNVPEACPVNIAPTTSTTLQLALGDALAISVMELRGVTREALGELHPGGLIGLELTPVGDLASDPERMPVVASDCSTAELLSVITRGCVGIAGVVDEIGGLIGVISDGDLRRNFERLPQSCAIEIATRNPCIVPRSMSAKEALRFLNENKIAAAFVVDDVHGVPPRPVGVIHIHDLLRHGMG